MTLKRLGLASVLVAALTTLSCGGGGGGGGGSGKIATPDLDYRLGVVYDAGTGDASFRVWAPKASNVKVRFYAAWNSGSATASYDLAKDLTSGGDVDEDGWNGVWTVDVPAVANGQLYQYAVDGRGALDPYAFSMGQFDSSRGGAGMAAVIDPDTIQPLDTDGNPEDWAAFTVPQHYAKREDAVIYEVHVRDWTIKIPQAQLQNPPGTYLAFTERLDHIKNLGVTHLQLLPVQAYYYGDESKRGTFESGTSTSGNNYNWGYDPHNYFAPEGMYAIDPKDPIARVAELKTLVNEAHKKGLGVTLDVVYNHMADTAILAAFAPGYYFRGTNHSGVGNDTASEKKMMRKLIIDSVAYWTREYKVDGFRFDLMGLIDSGTMTEAYQASAAVNPNVLFLGEGWNMDGGSIPSTNDQGEPIVAAKQAWMTSTNDIAVFSDSFRDILKGGGMSEANNDNVGFLTSESTYNPVTIDKQQLFANLRAEPTNFTADDPGDSIQYMTAHDGLTLHDKIAKILALNPSTSEAEIMKIARLGWVLAATSQGSQFVHAGCEMGRAKVMAGPSGEGTGNNTGGYVVYNSYDSTDTINGIDWATLMASGSPQKATYDYVSGLFALRASTDAFRLATKAQVDANTTLVDASQARGVAYKARDSAGAAEYFVFVNVAASANLTLNTGSDLRPGTVLVDSDEAGTDAVSTPSGFTLTATSITLSPRTAVVIKRDL
ncbi:MAG: alpha-amylase family glycosyl hydrolase [Anaeromyxobacter sp.]